MNPITIFTSLVKPVHHTYIEFASFKTLKLQQLTFVIHTCYKIYLEEISLSFLCFVEIDSYLHFRSFTKTKQNKILHSFLLLFVQSYTIYTWSSPATSVFPLPTNSLRKLTLPSFTTGVVSHIHNS